MWDKIKRNQNRLRKVQTVKYLFNKRVTVFGIFHLQSFAYELYETKWYTPIMFVKIVSIFNSHK